MCLPVFNRRLFETKFEETPFPKDTAKLKHKGIVLTFNNICRQVSVVVMLLLRANSSLTYLDLKCYYSKTLSLCYCAYIRQVNSSPLILSVLSQYPSF